ncbi:hypothetical protein KWH19_02345 [Xanthomonas campestris pv. pennamericanum]|nr:hypothetical protein [Xanthomonas euvesicatoria]MBV6808693.1 hypothetical protein [Xanthomonas campestris pv. pennamericanum]
MSKLSNQELRATLCSAVGVTSESGYAAYRSAAAGEGYLVPEQAALVR